MIWAWQQDRRDSPGPSAYYTPFSFRLFESVSLLPRHYFIESHSVVDGSLSSADVGSILAQILRHLHQEMVNSPYQESGIYLFYRSC
jgi:hypothetical protein